MLTSLQIIELIKNVTDQDVDIEPNSPLIGGGSLIDSMSLVQLCLALEEKSQEENFFFDWTSEKAMSSMNSIFRSPDALAAEFNRQLQEAQK